MNVIKQKLKVWDTKGPTTRIADVYMYKYVCTYVNQHTKRCIVFQVRISKIGGAPQKDPSVPVGIEGSELRV